MKYDAIIILGYKRSGTSLLRVMLNSHPDIAIGPETKFMEKVTKEYPKNFETFKKVTARETKDFEYSESDLKIIYDNSNSPAELLKNWCIAYRDKHHKKIWGDKTPQNFKYLKLISKAFPNALYIHIVRHPYDAMGSAIKRKTYRGVHTIIAWVVSNFRVNLVRSKHYIFFRYEDFIKNPLYYIEEILKELEVKKINLISKYQSEDHGRIAEGDLWNRPIDGEIRRNDKLLTPKDKLLINILCSHYLKKYGYS